MWVKNIIYTVGNAHVQQWNEQVRVIKYNNLGLVKDDKYSPNVDRNPSSQYLNDIVELPISFKVDQYISIVTYFRYNSENLQFVFNIKK